MFQRIKKVNIKFDIQLYLYSYNVHIKELCENST